MEENFPLKKKKKTDYVARVERRPNRIGGLPNVKWWPYTNKTTKIIKREIRIPNFVFIVHKRESRTTYPPPFVLPLFSV
jgi:hypothetical protein